MASGVLQITLGYKAVKLMLTAAMHEPDSKKILGIAD